MTDPPLLDFPQNSCGRNHAFYPTKTKHPDAQNDRSDQDKFSCDHQKPRFVIVFINQARVFVRKPTSSAC